MRFWLRGCSTRDVANELNTAMGTKLSYSTVTKLTNAIEPVLREWETRPIPKGIAYLLLDDHLRFLNEPEAFQTLLKSSNLIERFNYELRRILNSVGTMHSDLEVLKLM